MSERTLHYPFSSRDCSKWLDIAFAGEIRSGRGTPERGLYLDFRDVDLKSFNPSRPQHMPEDFHRQIELPDGLVQVRPAAHAINGGLRIDEQAESTLPGLFAVGEAATGSHGADRLGGGMVSGSQVFGARAGKFAAEHARLAGVPALTADVLAQPLARLESFNQGDKDAEQVISALQEAASTHLIVLRNEQGLETLLIKIQELTEEWLPQVTIKNVHALRRAIEAENLLLTAELMTRAAKMRRESRGSHYREDFPEQDDQHWRVNIVFRVEDGKLYLGTDSLGQSAVD
jgi:succinate dehydrogenase/fumarate reductase flavoprotein subunit